MRCTHGSIHGNNQQVTTSQDFKCCNIEARMQGKSQSIEHRDPAVLDFSQLSFKSKVSSDHILKQKLGNGKP